MALPPNPSRPPVENAAILPQQQDDQDDQGALAGAPDQQDKPETWTLPIRSGLYRHPEGGLYLVLDSDEDQHVTGGRSRVVETRRSRLHERGLHNFRSKSQK
jgi:hypothetical protein